MLMEVSRVEETAALNASNDLTGYSVIVLTVMPKATDGATSALTLIVAFSCALSPSDAKRPTLTNMSMERMTIVFFMVLFLLESLESPVQV